MVVVAVVLAVTVALVVVREWHELRRRREVRRLDDWTDADVKWLAAQNIDHRTKEPS